MTALKVRALAAVVIAASLGFAASAHLASCSSPPKEKRLEELRSKPERQASTYAPDIAAALAKSLPERVAPVPSIALDYLRRIDRRPDYVAYAPSAEELALFARYCELLPPAFKAAMEKGILGIYFIENFTGGGMTDFCFDPDGKPTYLLLFLNPKTLNTSLSDWVTYRDASPYAPDASGIELRSSCPGGEEYRGLLHTLVHESAHAYDYQRHATPYIMPLFVALPGTVTPTELDFTRGIWTDYAKPFPAYAIPRHAEASSYGLGKRLPISEALEQYRTLARSPFASFYGSASWAEDFAEAATWNYLRDKFGIGYEVALSRNGKEELRFSPGESAWSEERKKIIEEVLRN